MNCKNCEYGLKQSSGDFEKILCTYEEGECVKITELEAQIEKMQEKLKADLIAELKKQLRDEKCNDKDCPVFITLVQAIKERAETSKQLTKAKEIIKKMLYVSCNSDVLVQYPNCSKVLQSRIEAEQFLKDSDVEK